jgi:hypothetical protein
MRGSMRMTPAASMMKVGKWAIMGLSQPNKKPAAAGRTWPLLALRRHPAQGVSPFASTRRRNSPKLTPSLAFACQSPVFARQAG